MADLPTIEAMLIITMPTIDSGPIVTSPSAVTAQRINPPHQAVVPRLRCLGSPDVQIAQKLGIMGAVAQAMRLP
jgi:hypothetical protein